VLTTQFIFCIGLFSDIYVSPVKNPPTTAYTKNLNLIGKMDSYVKISWNFIHLQHSRAKTGGDAFGFFS